MSIIRFAARIVLVAVACAIATTWLGWMSVPCVGFIYGISDRRARAPGSIAAFGAMLGWAALLGAKMARGANLQAVAERIGGVMHVPAAVLAVVTLVFAALLCGTAAVLGAAAGDAVSRSVSRGSNGSPLSRE